MRKFFHNISAELKATAVYGVIVVLGFILSVVVYFAVTNVEKTTRILVDQQIPSLTVLRETLANVTEQERILYEYYATTDRRIFLQDYKKTNSIITEEIRLLEEMFGDRDLIASIKLHMAEIEQMASAFDVNIENDSTDWDLAREQLAKISELRRKVNRSLDSLFAFTTGDVNRGYTDTLGQLSKTTTTVTWYIIAIVIIAFVTGWYMRIFIQTSRKNKRLAEFTERNPHPIISVNDNGEIVYHNPATLKLLERHADEQLNLQDLVPENFKPSNGAELCPMPFTRSEQTFGQLHLSTEVHYLRDIELYDLHISDVTAERLAKQELEYQAYHCPQTGLQNNHRLQQKLQDKINSRTTFTLGLAEIKNYNHFVAAHGINAQQALINSAAQRLKLLVARSQHDIELFKPSERTFAFIIEGNITTGAINHQGHIIAEAMHEPLNTDYGDFPVELDMGFCTYPEHGNNTDSLIQNAQLALDEAIEDENQDFHLYRQQLSDKLNSNLTMVNQLKVALLNEELYLVYQPQLDLTSNRVIGMETLLRWRRGDQHISPAEFIPIAEQTGLIVEIGQWILHQACMTTQALAEEGFDDLVVAVNISPRQFRHPNFLSMVRQVLRSTGLSPKQLELEITEGVIMYNEGETITLLHQLKALGIQLSIDDFGTGYSSLSYLKQFPVDKLKIDQSFVRNLHDNDEDKAIVQAIIDLAKNLGLRTIAEGVEEEAHLTYLSSLKCDEIQGYYYSKPITKVLFHDFLTHQLA